MKARLASLAVIITLCSVAGGMAGYFIAARSTEPHLTLVTATACGVPASARGFAMPMQLLAASIPTLPVTVGPIEIPGIGRAISLRFDPTVDGRNTEVVHADGMIHLPLRFGHTATHPSRITLVCRNGRVATVQYALGTRERATFHVVTAAAGSASAWTSGRETTGESAP